MRLKSVINSVLFIWNHPCNKHKQLFVFIKVILWQLYKRTIKVPFTRKLFNGVNFVFHTDSTISSSIIYAKIPEYNEITFLRKMLSKDSIIIDVGANVGHFSLSFADISKLIYAFEPTPLSYEYLKQNFEKNKNFALHAVRKAVSSSAGVVEFLAIGGTNTTNRIVNNRSDKTIKVPTVTIDDFSSSKKLKSMDLIKIDVEGNELDVLKGAIKSIKDMRPLILFEILDMVKLDSYKSFFDSQNYVLFTLLTNGSVSFEHEDIIKSENLFACHKDNVKKIVEKQ